VAHRKYLRALDLACVRFAPPWPKSAQDYMAVNNLTGLDGWYDGNTPDGCARIFIRLQQDPAELVRVLTEEVCHHQDNDLSHPAVYAKTTSLLRSHAWALAVRDKIISLLLRHRRRAPRPSR